MASCWPSWDLRVCGRVCRVSALPCAMYVQAHPRHRSGAGKSTVLDILSARSKRGRITGELLIGGKPRTRAYKREIGYECCARKGACSDVQMRVLELYTHPHTHIPVYTYTHIIINDNSICDCQSKADIYVTLNTRLSSTPSPNKKFSQHRFTDLWTRRIC